MKSSSAGNTHTKHKHQSGIEYTAEQFATTTLFKLVDIISWALFLKCCPHFHSSEHSECQEIVDSTVSNSPEQKIALL